MATKQNTTQVNQKINYDVKVEITNQRRLIQRLEAIDKRVLKVRSTIKSLGNVDTWQKAMSSSKAFLVSLNRNLKAARKLRRVIREMGFSSGAGLGVGGGGGGRRGGGGGAVDASALSPSQLRQHLNLEAFRVKKEANTARMRATSQMYQRRAKLVDRYKSGESARQIAATTVGTTERDVHAALLRDGRMRSRGQRGSALAAGGKSKSDYLAESRAIGAANRAVKAQEAQDRRDAFLSPLQARANANRLTRAQMARQGVGDAVHRARLGFGRWREGRAAARQQRIPAQLAPAFLGYRQQRDMAAQKLSEARGLPAPRNERERIRNEQRVQTAQLRVNQVREKTAMLERRALTQHAMHQAKVRAVQRRQMMGAVGRGIGRVGGGIAGGILNATGMRGASLSGMIRAVMTLPARLGGMLNRVMMAPFRAITRIRHMFWNMAFLGGMGIAAGYAGVKAMRPAGDREMWQRQFSILQGEGDTPLEKFRQGQGPARERIGWLTDIAENLPMTVEEAVEAGRLMTVFGTFSKKGFELASDAAIAYQKNITQVVETIGRVKHGAFGLAMRALRTMGISTDMLRGEGIEFKGAQPTSSPQEIVAAIYRLWERNVGGMTKIMGDSFNTRLANVGDSFRNMMGTVMAPLLEASKTFLQGIQESFKFIRTNAKMPGWAAPAVAGVGAGFANMITGVFTPQGRSRLARELGSVAAMSEVDRLKFDPYSVDAEIARREGKGFNPLIRTKGEIDAKRLSELQGSHLKAMIALLSSTLKNAFETGSALLSVELAKIPSYFIVGIDGFLKAFSGTTKWMADLFVGASKSIGSEIRNSIDYALMQLPGVGGAARKRMATRMTDWAVGAQGLKTDEGQKAREFLTNYGALDQSPTGKANFLKRHGVSRRQAAGYTGFSPGFDGGSWRNIAKDFSEADIASLILAKKLEADPGLLQSLSGGHGPFGSGFVMPSRDDTAWENYVKQHRGLLRGARGRQRDIWNTASPVFGGVGRGLLEMTGGPRAFRHAQDMQVRRLKMRGSLLRGSEAAREAGEAAKLAEIERYRQSWNQAEEQILSPGETESEREARFQRDAKAAGIGRDAGKRAFDQVMNEQKAFAFASQMLLPGAMERIQEAAMHTTPGSAQEASVRKAAWQKEISRAQGRDAFMMMAATQSPEVVQASIENFAEKKRMQALAAGKTHYEARNYADAVRENLESKAAEMQPDTSRRELSKVVEDGIGALGGKMTELIASVAELSAALIGAPV